MLAYIPAAPATATACIASEEEPLSSEVLYYLGKLLEGDAQRIAKTPWAQKHTHGNKTFQKS